MWPKYWSFRFNISPSNEYSGLISLMCMPSSGIAGSYGSSISSFLRNLCGKILKEMEIPDHLTCMLRNLYAGQEATLELDNEYLTGSRLGKEYVKAVHFQPAYLPSLQSTSCKLLGWMNHKLESRLPGEILIPQICRLYHPYGRK